MHIISDELGISVLRIFHGTFMTSLDMRGLHISVLRLDQPDWIEFLDMPTDAPAWPRPYILKGLEFVKDINFDCSWNSYKHSVSIYVYCIF